MRRSKYGASEHQEQVAVIQWWALACKRYGLPEFALMAVPNAAKRSYALARYMKSEGLRSGVPDLFLAYPRRMVHQSAVSRHIETPFCGLWIEMKRKPNKPSAEQNAIIGWLGLNTYMARVCYSAQEAIDAIKAYLA